jgi:hypothetical protein
MPGRVASLEYSDRTRKPGKSKSRATRAASSPKPIEYVKICSIYGAGFFYIPGTDTCIKIGGWVRAEYAFGTGNSDIPYVIGADGVNTRIATRDLNMRARWVTSLDIRTQTEYGTLRAYSRAGFQTTTGETTQGRIYTERAFIQFAGFTFGKSQSYFDFFGGAFCYGCGYAGNSSQTGAAGVLLAAYTATFGNGFSATLSAEDSYMRRSGIWDANEGQYIVTATGAGNPGGFTVAAGNNNTLVPGNMPCQAGASDSYNLPSVGTQVSAAGVVTPATNPGVCFGDFGAPSIPDIVGSLRVDQAWGSAQVAGALHQLRAGYYGGNTAVGAFGPDNAFGWAAMAGIVINLPWNKGDKFWVEGAYTQGAASYVGWSATVGTTSTYQRVGGNSLMAAWALDSVFGCLGPGLTNCTNQQLTTYWTIAAALEHYWTPALRSDLFASYTAADFNGTATTLFCTSAASPVKTLAGGTPTTTVGCNPDFGVFNAGLRTIWNPAPQFDIGLEVMYTRVDTNFDPASVRLAYTGGGSRPSGLYTPSSAEIFSGILRFQRNFWP